jgi:hypothetical protein
MGRVRGFVRALFSRTFTFVLPILKAPGTMTDGSARHTRLSLIKSDTQDPEGTMPDGSARHTRLSSIKRDTQERFLLTSPRSLEACTRHCVRIDELQYRLCEDFVREAEAEGFLAAVGCRRFNVREQKRQDQLALVKREYQTICMARFQENVAKVLADLNKGAKHFVFHTMAGIYPAGVFDELERAIAAEGRRYLRYPPPYAKAAGQPDPGIGLKFTNAPCLRARTLLLAVSRVSSRRVIIPIVVTSEACCVQTRSSVICTKTSRPW